jgi:hypothetical protein
LVAVAASTHAPIRLRSTGSPLRLRVFAVNAVSIRPSDSGGDSAAIPDWVMDQQ